MSAELPAGWQWDNAIKDFGSLRENLLRFAARQGEGELSAGALMGKVSATALMGEVSERRKEASLDFLDLQREDGLCDSFVERITFWGKSYHPVMGIMKNVRNFISRCIYLKVRPKYPMGFLHSMIDRPGAVVEFIETQPWRNPWGIGNIAMDLGYALGFEWKVMGNAKARDALAEWFEWHDENADPKTGFWNPENIDEPRNLMAGGMHQFGIYFMFGREIKYPEAALKTTLALQEPTGLFSPNTFSHNCLDMDSVFVLANLYNRYNLNKAEVLRALELAFEANLKCFIPQGGAVNRVGVDKDSDWGSTYFRLMIIGWCARVLGIAEFEGPWEFRSRDPFSCIDAGASVPDWDSDQWYDHTDWPRP